MITSIQNNILSSPLNVLYNNIIVGVLSRDNDIMSFSYDQSWLNSDKSFPLSFSIGLDKKSHCGNNVDSFFKGLLPEGVALSAISNKAHVSEGNTLGILNLIGTECAGALSLKHDLLGVFSNDSKDVEITIDDLDIMIDNMSNTPLLTSVFEMQMSLAGVQQKTAVRIDNGRAFVPSYKKASTHIIKPESGQFDGVALNEYCCMVLADKVGINVPKVNLITSSNHVSFIISRYDRIVSKSGCTRKIHQIDLNQACDSVPCLKYEREGGQSFKDCFDISYKQNINCIERIVKWATFNFLISNNDAHSKNLSFLLRCRGGHRLAPHFDMLCTKVYPELSNDMSMSIGGKFDSELVSLDSWKLLIKDSGLSEKCGLAIIRDVQKEFNNNYLSVLNEIESKYKNIIDTSVLLDMKDHFEYKDNLLSSSLLDNYKNHRTNN